MSLIHIITGEPQQPHYTLGDLLAQCELSTELSAEDSDWLNAKPVGNELI
jgi:antitoxin ChpS